MISRMRVLLTGAGGFLGDHVCRQVPSNVQLIAAYHRSRPVVRSHISYEYCDLYDEMATEALLRHVRPDVMLHAAALSGESECRRDTGYTGRLNVEVVGQLGNWANENGARLLFTSTDLVFDGKDAPYCENDARRSLLTYGRSKIRAEHALDQVANALTVRLPLLYGIAEGARSGWLAGFVDRCTKGEAVRLFTDEYRTPAWAVDIAGFLWKLTLGEERGVLHLGGDERLSRLEIGRAVTKAFAVSDELLIPTTRAAAGMSDRPADTSLNSSKARSIGFRPHSLQDALARLARDFSGAPER